VLDVRRGRDREPSVSEVGSDADEFSGDFMADFSFALKLTVIGAKLVAFHAGVADDQRMSDGGVAANGAGDEFLFHGFLF